MCVLQLTDRASTIPKDKRACQSGTGLLDRKSSGEHLQSFNESINTKTTVKLKEKMPERIRRSNAQGTLKIKTGERRIHVDAQHEKALSLKRV